MTEVEVVTNVNPSEIALPQQEDVSASTTRRFSTVMAEFIKRKGLSDSPTECQPHTSTILADQANASSSGLSYVRFQDPAESSSGDVYFGDGNKETDGIDESVDEPLPPPPPDQPLEGEEVIINLPTPPSENVASSSGQHKFLNINSNKSSVRFASPLPIGSAEASFYTASQGMTIGADNTFKRSQSPATSSQDSNKKESPNLRPRILSFVSDSGNIFRSPTNTKALQSPPKDISPKSYMVNDTPKFSGGANVSRLSPFGQRGCVVLNFEEEVNPKKKKRQKILTCVSAILILVGIIFLLTSVVGLIVDATRRKEEPSSRIINDEQFHNKTEIIPLHSTTTSGYNDTTSEPNHTTNGAPSTKQPTEIQIPFDNTSTDSSENPNVYTYSTESTVINYTPAPLSISMTPTTTIIVEPLSAETTIQFLTENSVNPSSVEEISSSFSIEIHTLSTNHPLNESDSEYTSSSGSASDFNSTEVTTVTLITSTQPATTDRILPEKVSITTEIGVLLPDTFNTSQTLNPAPAFPVSNSNETVAPETETVTPTTETVASTTETVTEITNSPITKSTKKESNENDPDILPSRPDFLEGIL